MARIRLEGFVLDTEARQLTRGGRAVPLTPRALQLLELLVARRPSAVARAAIQDCLWPGACIADVDLPVLIHRLRQAMHDDARNPRFVRTVARFGYAFCGSAWVETDARGSPESQFECRLTYAEQDLVLRMGENLLGRTHEAAVRLSHTSVSRRHALIRVSESGATLEDCGSRNGTYRGNERVCTSVPLNDGDRILLGAALLIFRRFRRPRRETEDSTTRPTTPVPAISAKAESGSG